MDCPFPKKTPSRLSLNDEYFMSLAYNEALLAWQADETPIGAVAVLNDSVIASCHNSVITLNDPSAHAEMLAITQAARAVGDWRLNAVTIFVTKEPCPMCAGAMIVGRVGRVVYAVPDSKMGCLGGCFAMQTLNGINHRPQVSCGVLKEDCLCLLQSFFERKRLLNREKKSGN